MKQNLSHVKPSVLQQSVEKKKQVVKHVPIDEIQDDYNNEYNNEYNDF
jgi:hypothetical protein